MKASSQKSARARGKDRRILFTAITIAFPFLVFGLLESGLRMFGYGENLSLFTTERRSGIDYLVMNPQVKGRYFSRVEFSPNTSLDFFRMPKEAGTFRIFCLGGSTTAGFPYGLAGSFAAFLQDRLTASLPQHRVEVINLGMTATNSYAVLDIARELPPYDPDLIIVYDGHNEFYGALGSASQEGIGTRWLTLLYLRLVHWKTFQLMRDLYTLLASPETEPGSSRPRGTLMERLAQGSSIPLGGDLYRATLETFRDNLRDLAALCAEHKIPLILSTQASNLRHQPPFVSSTDGHSALGRRATLDRHLAHARTLLARGQSDSALAACRAALAIDSLHAEAHYLRARALDRAPVSGDVRQAYARARDCDQLRFRTSTGFNDVIRTMGRVPGVAVVDIEATIAAASPDSIPGGAFMLEHLHPNARGHFLMAGEYARCIRRNGLIATEPEWAAAAAVSDDSLWKERTITGLDEMAARRRIDLLLSGWPFKSDSSPVPPLDRADPLAPIIEQLVGGSLTWERAHVAAAELYAATGDTVSMEQEYRTLVRRLPFNVSAYLILAQYYVRWNRITEGRALLERSLAVEQSGFAHRILGGIAMNERRHADAILHLERALALAESDQERVETGYLLSVALHRTEADERALVRIDRVLELNPMFRPAIELREKIVGSRR